MVAVPTFPMEFTPWVDLGGLGQLSLPAVKRGARFQFGFNTAGVLPAQDIAENAPGWLQDAGISYNTTAGWLSGYLNPYIAIEGQSGKDWASGSDLRSAIHNAITGQGYTVDAFSINFNVETVAGAPPPPPVVGTRPPGPGVPRSGVPTAPDGSCNWDQLSATDWLACQLGVNPTTAMVVGALGALIAVVVITKR